MLILVAGIKKKRREATAGFSSSCYAGRSQVESEYAIFLLLVLGGVEPKPAWIRRDYARASTTKYFVDARYVSSKKKAISRTKSTAGKMQHDADNT